jgi:hypothetical protein
MLYESRKPGAFPMQTYAVDDELAAFIEHAAREKPFEQLSFNDALWRVVRRYLIGDQRLSELAEPPQEVRALGPLDGSETLGRTVNLGANRQQLHSDLNTWLTELRSRQPKKAPSPSARLWANSVPELKDSSLSDWTEICEHLGLNPAGDSARRFLQKWVKINRPSWPPVPNP